MVALGFAQRVIDKLAQRSALLLGVKVDGAASLLRELGSCNAWLLAQWIQLEMFLRVGRLPELIFGPLPGFE